MEQGFIGILQTVLKDHGKAVFLDASKCKALLADYTKGEYKKESRIFLQALDAKVQKAVEKTQEIDICRKQQVRVLCEDYGMAEDIAVDMVDTLIFVIKGVPIKKRETISIENQSKKEAEIKTETKYYYSINGEDKGPVDYDVIIKKINEGLIKRQTLMWKTGTKDWVEAASFNELANFFPPPAPIDPPPKPATSPVKPITPWNPLSSFGRGKPATPPVKPITSAGATVLAPVAGTILRFVAQEGANIKQSDTILILEFMNMELEIKANEAGKIHFLVQKGSQVNCNQPIATIS
ncbi:MAG: GYF domain-containing protein [Treponema sp.]|nr:GYF domain-containing protein [Treponema sp.]